MPKALTADWNLAQALYVQGVPYKAIAEKVGVTLAALRQRAHRYEWRSLKTEALATLSHSVMRHSGKTLVQRSGEVRSALGDELAESVGALRQTPAKPELEHLNQRAEVAGKLAGAASKVFAWSDQAERPLIIIGETANVLDWKPGQVTVAPPEPAALPEPS